MRRRCSWLVLTAALAAGCHAGPVTVARLDPARDQCGFCRMVVSDQRYASQLVAPYEEPRFFDDMGCLSNYLASAPALRSGTVAYVADHRTRIWVRADQAVYTRVDTITEPMGSHIVAHESAASRAADPDAASGTAIDVQAVFGGRLPPGGLQ
jgi:copper chaperone NosL